MAETIARVALIHLQVPLKEPFRTLKGDLPVRDTFLIVATTGAGRIGLGECAPLPTLDWLERSWRSLRDVFAPALVGQTVDSLEEIESSLDAVGDSLASARGAAETACLDLYGQIHHRSLSEILGTPSVRIESGIEAGLVIGHHVTVVDLLRSIEPHLDEGYRRVKLKIRPGFDVEFVHAVREHFGPELPLMVDGQGAYTVQDMEHLQQLDQEDLLMIEQPFGRDDLDGLAALQDRLTTPICLDETVNAVPRGIEAIERGCGRIVNLKLQNQGGLLRARALHDELYARGVPCFVGTRLELGVGRAAGLHLGTLPACSYPTDVAPSARWFVDDVVQPLLELAAPGRFDVPTRPGLGFLLKPEPIRRYQVRYEEFTEPRPA
jgi:O-succinylbenzoate synthase